jgi:predicted MFS family arabinose efflux permease
MLALGLLGIAAALLDFGGVLDQTLGRRAINLIRPEARGRLNGIFSGTFFVGGAVGSALAGLAWAHAGWTGACMVGAAFALAALALDLSGRAGLP